MGNEEQWVLFEKDKEKKIASIILNRPETLNACNLAMWDRINNLVQEVEGDEDVKVLIFKGRGRCFTSGHDVAELGYMHGHGSGKSNERSPSQRQRLWVDCNHFMGKRGWCQTILNCKKATIAQVHSYCYGGGVNIVLESDLAVASEDSLFTHPGWRYIGPTTDVWLMLETLRIKRAKEMMQTGIPINASQALEYGLVNKVVPLERLETETLKLAETIASLPFDGIYIGKVQFEAALEAMGMGSALTASYILHCLQTSIRYEPGEFNLFRERRDKGIKAALVSRERHYKKE